MMVFGNDAQKAPVDYSNWKLSEWRGPDPTTQLGKRQIVGDFLENQKMVKRGFLHRQRTKRST